MQSKTLPAHSGHHALFPGSLLAVVIVLTLLASPCSAAPVGETAPASPPVRLVLQGAYGREARLPAEAVHGMEFSGNGQYLAANIAQTLVVYEWATGRELWRLDDITDYFFVNDALFVTTGAIQNYSFSMIDPATGDTYIKYDVPYGFMDGGVSSDKRYVFMVDGFNGKNFVIFDSLNHTIAAEWSLEETEVAPSDWVVTPESKQQTIETLRRFGLEQYLSNLMHFQEHPGGWTHAFKLYHFITSPLGGRYSLYVEAKQPGSSLLFKDGATGAVTPLRLPSGDGARPLCWKDVKRNDPKRKKNQEPRMAEYAAFSGDSSLLSVSDAAGNAHIFSVSGQPEFTATIPSGWLRDNGFLFRAALRQNGPGVLTCAFTGRNGDVIVRDLDYRSMKCLPGAVHPGKNAFPRPTAFALSGDGRAATGADNGSVRLVDMGTGRAEELTSDNRAAWTAMAFSGDGSKLFGATASGTIYCFTQGRAVRLQGLSAPAIHLLASNPDGTRLWAASGDKKLYLIPPEGGRLLVRELPAKAEQLAYDPRSDSALVLVVANPRRQSMPKRLTEFTVTDWKAGNARIGWIDNVATDDAGNVKYKDRRPESSSPYDDPAVLGYDPVTGKMVVRYWLARTFQFFHLGSMTERPGPDMQMSYLRSVLFSPDGTKALGNHYAYGGTDSRLSIFSTDGGAVFAERDILRLHPYGVLDGGWLSGSRRFVTLGKDGSLRLWEHAGDRITLLLSWMFFNNGNYVVMDEANRFDTPEIERLDGIHWTARSVPGKALPLDCFLRDYYQPRLAEYVLSGRALPDLPDISARNLYQASVAIRKIMPSPGIRDHVSVIVEVDATDKNRVQETRDLKLFRDGRLVARHQGPGGDGALSFKDGKAFVIFDKIALPRSKNSVEFTAYAFNEDKVRSQIARARYAYTPADKPQPRLRLLAVGVNSFDNPSWNLRYAANDARAFHDILPRYLPLSRQADARLLASAAGADKPAKATIRRHLEELAGMHSGTLSHSGDSIAGPDDVVALCIASHGLTAGDTFYILPADVPGRDASVTPELLRAAISAEELGEWMTSLDARELILILDTCESGTALGGDQFKPGPMGDRGLGQLVYDKAARVLCATNGNNAALEVERLGHGILSYALLREGLEEGRVSHEGRKAVTIRDWLVFGKERTAELYTAIGKGVGAGITRGKLALDVPSGAPGNPFLGQTPYFFDSSGESTRLELPH